MDGTILEVLQFVKENDVKFIRLAFCDLFGMPKNISVMPGELERAFTQGVPFDAFAINGFTDIINSDLLLFPDPTTLEIMPWRPEPGRVIRFYCDIKKPNGEIFQGDTRNILKNVLKKLDDMELTCKIGADLEFYLFKTDENGDRTDQPFDKGGYLDISPLDKGENVRREICLCLKDINIPPQSSNHAQGPGQNEIDFKPYEALTCADNMMTFKNTVKNIAARNGLYASFLPKPIPNESGNGMHITLSLFKDGKNIFKTGEESHSKTAESFIAGILEKAPEITAFLNPIESSYKRLGEFEAPKYVSWSHSNRSQLVRIPFSTKENVSMELRSPDMTANPYVAFAMVIAAGIYGIENEIVLQESVNEDLLSGNAEAIKNLVSLPDTLKDALNLAKDSELVKSVIPEIALEKYFEYKCQRSVGSNHA